MTPEQRLDRVERILGLYAREERRWRLRSREQDEKIDMLIQARMETSELLDRSSAIHDKEMADLRRSQKLTDQALRAFIKRSAKE